MHFFLSARVLKRSCRFGKCHEVDEMNGINGLNNLLARGSRDFNLGFF